jgi:hypothetical protein
MMSKQYALGPILALAMLAGCAGGGALPHPAGSTPLGSKHSATARFVITIPPKPHHRRGARYISPSTESLWIGMTPTAGGTALNLDMNLTPASSNCHAISNGTQCENTLALAPGTYKAIVDTYDQQSEKGNVLSEGQSLAVVIKAGQANTISLTLGGVPHSLAIASGAVAVHGTQAAGFTLYGKTAQALAVTAKDSKGNTIVGPASLDYTASVTSGSGWKVQATPNPATPNTFEVTPPGTNGSAATLKVTFNYSTAACDVGSVCTASFDVKNDVQQLFVAGCFYSCFGNANNNPIPTGDDAVVIYDPPYTESSPTAIVTKGVLVPVAVAADNNGHLFVANQSTVTIYQAPFSSSSAPIATLGSTNGIQYPTGLAVNSKGDVFVVDNLIEGGMSSYDEVTEYTPPYSSSSMPANTMTYASAGVDDIAGIAVDPHDNFMIENCAHDCNTPDFNPSSVLMFGASNYGAAPVSIGSNFGAPVALAFDATGDMYVGACPSVCSTQNYEIKEYAAPLSASSSVLVTVAQSQGIGQTGSLGVDTLGNLFNGNVLGGGANTVELPPPYSANATTIFGGNTYQSYLMQVDGFNTLVVSDQATLWFSTPPYSTLTQIGPALFDDASHGDAYDIAINP